eukprot:1443562-Rhodomonas_salina.3
MSLSLSGTLTNAGVSICMRPSCFGAMRPGRLTKPFLIEKMSSISPEYVSCVSIGVTKSTSARGASVVSRGNGGWQPQERRTNLCR